MRLIHSEYTGSHARHSLARMLAGRFAYTALYGFLLHLAWSNPPPVFPGAPGYLPEHHQQPNRAACGCYYGSFPGRPDRQRAVLVPVRGLEQDIRHALVRQIVFWSNRVAHLFNHFFLNFGLILQDRAPVVFFGDVTDGDARSVYDSHNRATHEFRRGKSLRPVGIQFPRFEGTRLDFLTVADGIPELF